MFGRKVCELVKCEPYSLCHRKPLSELQKGLFNPIKIMVFQNCAQANYFPQEKKQSGRRKVGLPIVESHLGLLSQKPEFFFLGPRKSNALFTYHIFVSFPEDAKEYLRGTVLKKIKFQGSFQLLPDGIVVE